MLGITEIRWEEIASLYHDEVPMSHALLAHLGVLGALLMPFTGKHGSRTSQESLKVQTGDKRKISISTNYKNCRPAIDAVRAAVNPRLLAEYRRRLAQGDSIAFGKITLGPSGIGWKNRQPVGYSEIDKAYIGGRNLRVKVVGKWLDTISVPMRQVPNVFVLLDLVQEKKADGIVAPHSTNAHV